MMRGLVILGALLLGLVGLGMSLCGGGVLFFGISSSPASQAMSIVGITVPFILVGGLFIWLSARVLRKKLNEQDPKGPV